MDTTPENAAQDFLSEWSKFHFNRCPTGWMLRKDSATPWVRFHALPQSKRYAENEAEAAIILSRANAIGDRLLGKRGPCWQVRSLAVWDGHQPEATALGDFAGEFVESENPYEGLFEKSDDPHETTWRFYVRQVEWSTGAFDAELTSIANDEIADLIWISRENGAIFAPYDGGFDLFPETFKEAEALKAEHPEWLSSHPGGL